MLCILILNISRKLRKQHKKLFYFPKNNKRIYFLNLLLKNKFFVIKYFIVHNNYYYNIFQKNKLNKVPEETEGFRIIKELKDL